MIYNTSITDHQNPISPMKKRYGLFSNYFYFDNRSELIPDYHVIKYSEKKGFLKKKKFYIVDTLKIVDVIIGII